MSKAPNDEELARSPRLDHGILGEVPGDIPIVARDLHPRRGGRPDVAKYVAVPTTGLNDPAHLRFGSASDDCSVVCDGQLGKNAFDRRSDLVIEVAVRDFVRPLGGIRHTSISLGHLFLERVAAARLPKRDAARDSANDRNGNGQPILQFHP